MGETRRREFASRGQHAAPVNDGAMILEPRGMAPVKRDKSIDFKVGVARDACAVAIQVGDILMHTTPAQARETARGLLAMAQTVEALIAKRDGTIITA